MAEQGFQKPETTVSASTTRFAERPAATVAAVLVKRQGDGFVAVCQKSDGTSTPPVPVESLDAAQDYMAQEFGVAAAPESAPVAENPAPMPMMASRPKNTSVY